MQHANGRDHLEEAERTTRAAEGEDIAHHQADAACCLLGAELEELLLCVRERWRGEVETDDLYARVAL